MIIFYFQVNQIFEGCENGEPIEEAPIEDVESSPLEPSSDSEAVVQSMPTGKLVNLGSTSPTTPISGNVSKTVEKHGVEEDHVKTKRYLCCYDSNIF